MRSTGHINTHADEEHREYSATHADEEHRDYSC